MPRTCTVCALAPADRQAADRLLVRRSPYRHIAARFGVSTGALQRHAKEHLPSLIAKAHEAEEWERARGLLTDIEKLQAQTLIMLNEARGSGELAVALRAVDAARRNIELMLRANGELQDGPVVNVILSSEWIELRGRLVAALEPFPAAREAVVRAVGGGAHGRG